MKTLEEQVEEFKEVRTDGLFEMFDGDLDKMDTAIKKGQYPTQEYFDKLDTWLKQALLTAEKRERERIREFAKNDWVFPPPDITGHLHDGRAELPAEYVRRMVLTSLLPDKRRITD